MFSPFAKKSILIRKSWWIHAIFLALIGFVVEQRRRESVILGAWTAENANGNVLVTIFKNDGTFEGRFALNGALYATGRYHILALSSLHLETTDFWLFGEWQPSCHPQKGECPPYFGNGAYKYQLWIPIGGSKIYLEEIDKRPNWVDLVQEGWLVRATP